MQAADADRDKRNILGLTPSIYREGIRTRTRDTRNRKNGKRQGTSTRNDVPASGSCSAGILMKL